jgi:hypothetical protein
VVGDFNGDGKLDLAVANLANPSTVSVLLGNGDGTFQSHIDYSTGLIIVLGLAVADVNNDGNLDLVAPGVFIDGHVAILLGNGDGTFQPPLTYTTDGNAQAVAVADLNGDGKPDLAAVSSLNYSGEAQFGLLTVLLGNGDGTFLLRKDFAGDGSQEVISGDFNGDGKLDLATTNRSNVLSVFLGNGDGTFQPHVDYPTGNDSWGIATGDFNGDGILDLAVTNFDDSTLSILIGNGDGTFQAQVNYATGQNPISVTAGDFNRDGKLDLAVANETSSTVSVLLGNGDGTFRAHVDYSTAQTPWSVTTADFNKDGKLDLAVADNETNGLVSILLGNGDGTFQTHRDYATGPYADSVVAADFNGDTILDLAVASEDGNGSSAGNAVSILLGNGDGTFQPHVDYPAGVSVNSVFAADVNGDGKLDLITASQLDPAAVVLLGNGDGTFGPFMNFVTAAEANFVIAGDFNGDGVPDLAAADGGGGISIIFSTPAPAFYPSPLHFGNQSVGTTSLPLTLTLSNSGTAPLNISSLAASGDYAEVSGCPTTLGAGANCAISVTFSPTQPGTRTGSISVSDTAPSSPQTVALTGVGIGPLVALSPGSLTFATQVVHTTSPAQVVTLTNTGTGTLNISSIGASGDFGESNTCGSSVAAGASCTINVTYKPTAKGTRTASVSITDNAVGSPQKVSLKGTGTVVKLSPTSLNFGSVQVGHKSAARTVTVTNTGTVLLSITNIGLTGTNAGDFSESNTCGSSLGGGKSCSISMTFTPRAKGSRKASLSISDNGGGSPQTGSLMGTGT